MRNAPDSLVVQVMTFSGKPLLFHTHQGRTQVRGPKECEALCAVLNTAFLHGLSRLLDDLVRSSGRSYEGVVAYGFHSEFPHEIPEGRVLISYFELEQNLPEEVFIDVCFGMIRAHLNVCPDAGVEAELRSAALALRERGVTVSSFFEEPLEPLYLLAVYEADNEEAPAVAELYSDGRHGALQLYDSAHTELLVDVLLQSSGDGSAFAAESLQRLVEHGLGAYAFEGEITARR